jgi:anti-sigma-K factor RskA
MNDPTCTDVHDAAAEYALDILDSEERSAVAAHLLRCPECRREVAAMTSVGARLLDLVPGTEPPLGFDRRVLARVGQTGGPRRRRWGGGRARLLAGMASVAAAAAVIFGSLGWFPGRTTTHRPTPATLTAHFFQGTRDVGEVYASGGNTPWLRMEVDGTTGTEKVTCELLATDGSVMRLGSFDLVRGSGSWGAPDGTDPTGISGVRLVGSGGQVIATALFRA